MATICTAGAPSSAPAQAFQRALHRLLPLVDFRERWVAGGLGLSVTQGHALLLLSDEEGMPVNDLAARLYLDKSTISRVAGGLEAKGYVARTRDPQDLRVVRLTATPSGHRVRLRLQDELAALYSRLLADFDPEVGAAMTRMVTKLADACASRIRTHQGSCRVLG